MAAAVSPAFPPQYFVITDVFNICHGQLWWSVLYSTIIQVWDVMKNCLSHSSAVEVFFLWDVALLLSHWVFGLRRFDDM
jgi:hypothetical protein